MEKDKKSLNKIKSKELLVGDITDRSAVSNQGITQREPPSPSILYTGNGDEDDAPLVILPTTGRNRRKSQIRSPQANFGFNLKGKEEESEIFGESLIHQVIPRNLRNPPPQSETFQEEKVRLQIFSPNIKAKDLGEDDNPIQVDDVSFQQPQKGENLHLRNLEEDKEDKEDKEGKEGKEDTNFLKTDGSNLEANKSPENKRKRRIKNPFKNIRFTKKSPAASGNSSPSKGASSSRKGALSPRLKKVIPKKKTCWGTFFRKPPQAADSNLNKSFTSSSLKVEPLQKKTCWSIFSRKATQATDSNLNKSVTSPGFKPEPPKKKTWWCISSEEKKPVIHQANYRKAAPKIAEIKSKQQEQYNIKTEKTEKAITIRRRARCAYFFLYLGMLITLLIVGATYTVQRDHFSLEPSADLNLNLQNCKLSILDHQDSSVSSPVYMKYRISRELKTEPAAKVVANTDARPQKIEATNDLDLEYCQMSLFVKEGTPLQSLNIECSNCYIVQDTSFQLEISGTLNMDGKNVHANFRNIKIGQTLNYHSYYGFLQLTNIDAPDASTNSINMEIEGDVIIQSTQNFQLEAYTQSKAYCLNAPFLVQTQADDCAMTDTAVCHVIYSLCNESPCATSGPKYEVNSASGNVYSNIIPEVGIPTSTSGYTMAQAPLFSEEKSFSSDIIQAISNFSQYVNNQTLYNPFIIMNLGNIQSQSSLYTKWVVSSIPTYAYLRPWWIGTMSATILSGYMQPVGGFLLPGFCPFTPTFTLEQMLEVQNLLEKKIEVENSLITFISDPGLPLPPKVAESSTGVFHYPETKNPTDKWYSLVISDQGEITLVDQDYTKQGVILSAVIISLIIAGYMAYLVVRLTVIGINFMYHKLVNFANHLDSYAKLEQNNLKSSKDSKDIESRNKTAKDYESSFLNILRHAPSPSAFIDYFCLIIYGQFSNSVDQYYHLLFRKVDQTEIADKELDPRRDMIKGTDAKILYEKFCFMNHLTEQKLTDPASMSLLYKYGFQVMTRNDLSAEVFMRMNIKNYDTFLAKGVNGDEELNSLDLYMKENVTVTDFPEDQVEIETFMRVYENFCNYNRLPVVLISPSLMKEKFGVDVITVPQQFIVRRERDDQDLHNNNNNNATVPLIPKLKKWWKRSDTYILDPSKLDNHFNLVMKKMNALTDDQLQDATIDLILYPRWWIWDAVTVLFHLLIGALISVPFVCLLILIESQYRPWSVKDPLGLFMFHSLITDPAGLISHLYTGFAWNIVVMAIVTSLWAISFLDLMLYYRVMDFPQDRSFKRTEESHEQPLKKLGRQIEWILVLFALYLYFGYIGLVTTWMLLGALINPYAFLPFASAAITFITFVVTKYKTFKRVLSQGTQAVMQYLKVLLGGFINKVLATLTQGIEEIANKALKKGEALLESGVFQSAKNKLIETGIVDHTTMDKYIEKIQSIDSRAIVEGLSSDPTLILKEIEEFTKTLKEKTIKQVEQECEKRNIPPSLVSLAIAIVSKDTEKTKDKLSELLKDCCKKNSEISLEVVGVIIEMLFPQGINKEDMVLSLTAKIILLALREMGILDDGKANQDEAVRLEVGLKAFVSMLQNFKNIKELKIEEFVYGLKQIFKQLEKIMPKEEILGFILAFLDIMSVLAKEKVTQWEFKEACLSALNILIENIEKSIESTTKKQIENIVKAMENTTKEQIENIVKNMESATIKQILNETIEKNMDSTTKEQIENIVRSMESATKEQIENIIKNIDSTTKEQIENIVMNMDSTTKEQIENIVKNMESTTLKQVLIENIINDMENAKKKIEDIKSRESTTKNQIMIFKKLIKLISLLSCSSSEVPYDPVTKQALKAQDKFQIINEFFDIVTFVPAEDMKESQVLRTQKKNIQSLVYFGIAYIRQEIDDIPIEVIKNLIDMLGAQNICKPEFILFSLNLASAIKNHPSWFYQRLDKCIGNFGFNKDLENFIKVLTCYSLESYEYEHPAIAIEQNDYFIKIAETLKINANELLGLIRIIYNKDNDAAINIFIEAAFKRFGLREDKQEILKNVIDICLSEKEDVLLRAVKNLNLQHEQLLLIGKGILNPDFISSEQYKDVGIETESLIGAKQKIYNSSDESYEYWKSELRKEIDSSLEEERRKTEEDQTAESQEEYKKIEKKLNLVKVYLQDWSTWTITKRNIESLISNLDNPQNELKKIINDKYEKGASYNELDFLVMILSIRNLELYKGRKVSYFDKEKENSITSFAEYLGVSVKALGNTIKMFTLNDDKIILKCFLEFFPEENKQKDNLKGAIIHGLKQASLVQNQIDFIAKKLPENIKLLEQPSESSKTFALPGGLLKNLFFGYPNANMTIDDCLGLILPIIKKMSPKEGPKESPKKASKEGPKEDPEEKLKKAKEAYQQKILTKCYEIGLFAKGLLPNSKIAEILKGGSKNRRKNEQAVKLVNVLMQHDHSARLSGITELYNEKYHPIKIITAFYGLLTRQNFKIKYVSPGIRPNQENKLEEPLKIYLATLLKVHPEVFDVFEIAFERNPSKFLQKALPLIRRIISSSLADVNLVESMFLLSLGEHFNPSYIANTLEISPDIIEFFVTLARLNMDDFQESELNRLPSSIPFSKVLAKLKIMAPEFIALTRLVFGSESINTCAEEIIKSLGLQKSGTSAEDIDLDFFKSLARLNNGVDPQIGIFGNKAVLTDLKVQTANLFTSLGLESSADNALIISSLTLGNYLVIQELSDHLDWAFPHKDLTAKVAIIELTMGICGLLNPNIKMTQELDEEVTAFVNQFYPKTEDFKFEPIKCKSEDEVLPNNTLAYAIYLIYHTLDITPPLTQAFLLDTAVFKKLENEVKSVDEVKSGNELFLLSLVLNFTYAPDIIRDFLGLYEWNKSCKRFCVSEWGGEEGLGFELFIADKKINKLFSSRFSFDYEDVLKLANEAGLIERNPHSDMSIDSSYFHTIITVPEKIFNKAINESLYLLLCKPTQRDQELRRELQSYFPKASSQFLRKLAQLANTSEDHRFYDFKQERLAIGELKMRAIVEFYKLVAGKSGGEKRMPDFEIMNLCMLGTIAMLRKHKANHMVEHRVIYNLHQLTMNIERKTYLEDHFYKMSKFKIMKLAGVSLGLAVSNILEWHLPESLFTEEYVENLDNELPGERVQVRFTQCEKVALNYQDPNIKVGDLVGKPAAYKDYIESSRAIRYADSWDYAFTMFGMSGYCEGDLRIENLEPTEPKVQNLLKQCRTENPLVYLPKELIASNPKKYEDSAASKSNLGGKIPTLNEKLSHLESSKTLDKQKLKQQKNKRKKDDEDPRELRIDLKTGITYKFLKRKIEDFEWILTDPNMNLIQNVLNGDPSAFTRGDHDFIRDDQKKKKAEIYRALFGLQSLMNRDYEQKRLLKDSLYILTPKLKSNVAKLEQLLSFFITQEFNQSDIVSALEIDEGVVNFFLMSLREEKEDVEILIETIQKTLILSQNEADAIRIIKKIYHFNETGWTDLVKKLSKDLRPNEDEEPEEFDKRMENRSPLYKLMMQIDVAKLKKEAESKSLIKQEIFSFIQVPKYFVPKYGNKDDKNDRAFSYVLEGIIRGVIPVNSLYSYNELITDDSLQILKDFLKFDLSALCEKLLLPNTSNISKKKNVTATDKFLSIFRINASEETKRIIEAFLVMANRGVSSFKTKVGYKDIINTIVKIVNQDLPEPAVEDLQSKLGKLLTGILVCDMQLIIESFISKDTITEAYQLYHLCHCFKLATTPNFDKYQVERNLKVLFLALPGRNISQELAKNRDNPILEGLLTTEFTDYEYVEPTSPQKENEQGISQKLYDTAQKELSNKIESLFSHVETKGKRTPPQNLLWSLKASLNKKPEQLKFSEDVQDFQNDLMKIFVSILDGSFLVKVLTFFVKDAELRAFFVTLFEFMLQLSSDEKQDMTKNWDSLMKAIQKKANCDSNHILKKVLLFINNSMKIYFTFRQERRIDGESLKKAIVTAVYKFSPDSQILLDMVSVVLGQDISIMPSKNKKVKFQHNSKKPVELVSGASQRMDIFFTKLIPDMFTNLVCYLPPGSLEIIYDLVLRLKADFSLKDPHKMKEVFQATFQALTDLHSDESDSDLEKEKHKFVRVSKAVMSLLEGDFEGSEYIIKLMFPETEDASIKLMLSFLAEVKGVLNFGFANQLSLAPTKETVSAKKKIRSENWTLLLSKIKEGTASSRDLFHIIDQEGDQSGAISEREFHKLAIRLGFKLSQHRIKEIFTKVKGQKAKGGIGQELNEREFEQALEYLEEKSLQQALQLLGITPEILAAALIHLIILLILMFVFIFLGITAFAIGGVFGAIVNSIFPAIGGLILNKGKDAQKDTLDKKTVEKASDVGFEITASEQL